MNDFNEIIKSTKPTLVDFYATWCGPCKMQAPILEKVKETIGDSATIIKIDIDRNEELAARYRVQSVPTIILFKDGEPVWRTVGVQPQGLLEAKIHEHIPTKSDE
ncbi:MAG: thioredoxin [Muribaculaceae bacterium]|nr:thioredoxin [Muribaculaceae bacterium]